MSAKSTGDEKSPPKQLETDWGGEPSRYARVRIERSDLTVDMEVPSSLTRPLLDTTINALFVIGAVICPWLTFKAVPPDFPTWATLGTIATQLLLLGLVVMSSIGTSEYGPKNLE